jgi:hypothetical protein
VQSGEWGPEQVHPLPLAGRLRRRADTSVRPKFSRASARRILDTVRPKCSSQAPAFGKWQHTRFLTQSAAVDTPVSAVNLTLNHSTTDPHMCVADPGRQTHLTFWLWREAGLRLSLLLASSSITCSWTMGTAEVALPIGSLLDESPPPEVIH